MLRLPTNSDATTRAAKCVLSSDSTRTSAPGRPARINCATCSGLMPVILPSLHGTQRVYSALRASPLRGRPPGVIKDFAAAGTDFPCAYNGYAMQTAPASPPDDELLLSSARRSLDIEARAVQQLHARL